MSKLKLNKIYEVYWEDACSDAVNWVEPDHSVDLWEVKTVGYLHEKDKKKIVLKMSIGEDMISQLIAIPKSWIKSIKRLE